MAFPGNERPPSSPTPRAAKRNAQPTKIWPPPLDGWPANRPEELNRTQHPGRALTAQPVHPRLCDALPPDRGPHPPPLPAQPHATRSKLTRALIRLALEPEYALRVL